MDSNTTYLDEATFHGRFEIVRNIIESPHFEPQKYSMIAKTNALNLIFDHVDMPFTPTQLIELINMMLNKVPKNERAHYLNDVSLYLNNNSPLLTALLACCDIKVIKCLLEHGASPKYILTHHFDMHTYLTIGSANQRLDICKLLIKYGANPNMVIKNNGKTAFMTCVDDKYTDPDVVNHLAQISNINHQDNDGNTAIINCIKKNAGFVQILLKHNPDLTIKNNNGQNVFDITGLKSRDEIYSFFKIASKKRKRFDEEDTEY